MALAKYEDTIFQTDSGRAYSGVVIEALSGGIPAQLYFDDIGTEAFQITSNPNGLFAFWVEEGTYDLRYSVGGVAVGTQEDVAIYNLVREIELAADTGAEGVGVASGETLQEFLDTVDQVSTNKANASALGVAGADTDMGAFTGSTIPDNQTAKQAIQAVETAVDKTFRVPGAEVGGSLPASASRARRLFRWATDGSPTLVNAATAYAEDFGWVPDSAGAASGNSFAFDEACDFLTDTWGGGTLIFPPGISYHTGLVMGDGSNSQQSTKHHNIRLKGQGSASSDEVSNTDITGITVLKYAGATSSTGACLRLDGPIHDILIEDMELDADSRAGFGLDCIHVGSPMFSNVVVRNWTDRSYRFTTRTGYPVGAAYGMGNGALYDCYAYSPASNAANGILMTSGVSTGTTLVSNPDTANLDIYGGVFFYGGSTGTSGLELYGCDNNSVNNSQLLPKGGNDGGGKSVKWTQWPGSPVFPLGNRLIGVGFGQAMSGAGGTLGNDVHMDSSDSGWTPNIVGVNFYCVDGKIYKNGQRAYSTYSIQTAELNGSAQNTTSTSYVDVTGLSLSLTYPAGSKLKLSYSGFATKSTSGDGDFILFFSASNQGPTISRIAANGTYGPVTGQCVIDLPTSGSAVTAKLRFKSNDANQVSILYGTLIAEILY